MLHVQWGIHISVLNKNYAKIIKISSFYAIYSNRKYLISLFHSLACSNTVKWCSPLKEASIGNARVKRRC